jgi:hypothetical protein
MRAQIEPSYSNVVGCYHYYSMFAEQMYAGARARETIFQKNFVKNRNFEKGVCNPLDNSAEIGYYSPRPKGHTKMPKW